MSRDKHPTGAVKMRSGGERRGADSTDGRETGRGRQHAGETGPLRTGAMGPRVPEAKRVTGSQCHINRLQRLNRYVSVRTVTLFLW